jgi:Sulfotransferase family
MPTHEPTARDLAETAILILGAPRSGTTWLAKIFDSHPDVLYRHEPDETCPAPADLPADRLRPLVQSWIADRCLRTATKRPFFAKSWQPAPARLLRTALAYALNAASRLPGPGTAFSRLPVPDLGAIGRARAVIKSVRWSDGAGTFARALPDSRTVLILRHPCGQVASVMRGTRQHRFDLREPGTDMPFDEAAARRRAAASGVDPNAFQTLPDAAQYAWAWVAFNETAAEALAGLPNAHIVIYETLCAHAETEAQALFRFVGLAWHEQTAAFIAHSTSHGGPAGYYAVVRNSLAAAEHWRATMAPQDQAAVRGVMRHSSLARFWPGTLVAGY